MIYWLVLLMMLGSCHLSVVVTEVISKVFRLVIFLMNRCNLREKVSSMFLVAIIVSVYCSDATPSCWSTLGWSSVNDIIGEASELSSMQKYSQGAAVGDRASQQIPLLAAGGWACNDNRIEWSLHLSACSAIVANIASVVKCAWFFRIVLRQKLI